MSHDKMIDIIKAHKDGKEIQCRSLNGFNFGLADTFSISKDHRFNFDLYEYRVKPEIKKRFIRVDELPNIVWFKHIHSQIACLVTAISQEGVVWGNSTDRYDIGKTISIWHKEEWQYSASHKGPWHSFEVQDI